MSIIGSRKVPSLLSFLALVLAARLGAANVGPPPSPPTKPSPAPSPNVAMIVKVDREATEAKLIIPRKLVSGLAAIPGEGDPVANVAESSSVAASPDEDSAAVPSGGPFTFEWSWPPALRPDSTAAQAAHVGTHETPQSDSTAGSSITANHTIFAGLALSAAVASLVFVKRRRAAVVSGAVVAAVVAFCLATPLAADIPPFNKGPRPRPAPVDPQPSPAPGPQTDPLTAAGLVKELSDDLARNVTGQVRLVVSNDANVVTLVLPKSAPKAKTEAKAIAAPKAAP